MTIGISSTWSLLHRTTGRGVAASHAGDRTVHLCYLSRWTRSVTVLVVLVAASLACSGGGVGDAGFQDGQADALNAADRRGTAAAPGASANASPHAQVDKSAPRIARLVTALASANTRVTDAATDSLASIGPAATDALIPAIKGNDHQVRFLAVKAMVEYGPAAEKAVPALTAVVEQRAYNDMMVDNAIRALGNIGPAAGSAASALAPLLDDPIEFPRHAPVYVALAAMGPAAAAALPAVVRNLNSKGAPTAAARIGGPAALEALEQKLLKAGPEYYVIGVNMAEALADMGPDGLRVLERARTSDAPGIRAATIAAYRSLGGGGVSGLVAMLSDARICRSPTYRTDAPITCQVEAATALGAIGQAARPALPALERLLQESPDAPTQRAARQAIAAIRG